MRRFAFLFFLVLVLGACAGAQDTPPTLESTQQPRVPISDFTGTPTDDPALLPTLFPNTNAADEMTRLDQQGAVVVEVTPLNLEMPADTLDFDVAMNTHTIDLSMDLASLSTLSTDTGVTVGALRWDATSGGHHLNGRLIFPRINEGTSILEGAHKLTLVITHVDAPSRVFEWGLR